jgi:hypothetical protein
LMFYIENVHHIKKISKSPLLYCTCMFSAAHESDRPLLIIPANGVRRYNCAFQILLFAVAGVYVAFTTV